MHPANRDKVLLAFAIGAAGFWWLAVYGAVNAYSPVPFWDMWDGYLAFFVNSGSGKWGVWWAQHNEHRILLARLLFWMDLAWFDGLGWFLICVNYLLLASAGWLFWRAWQENSQGQNEFVGFFLIAWIISWTQYQNLTWGFQSQFILAQLLPLAAFYQLHRFAASDGANQRAFLLACVLGVLSIGSMANGVLALPLMTFYALLTRLGRRRTLMLALLSCACLLGYFIDYQAPQGHGSLSQALRENPLGLASYVLIYLGNPFYSFVRGGEIGLRVAQLAGAFLVMVSAGYAWLALRDQKRPTLPLAMLVFILYIGGTAVGAAGGRLMFGVEQALKSRYATPALMAWAALFVLMAPQLNRWAREKRWIAWGPFAIMFVLMLPVQLGALSSNDDMLFERRVAALALELGIQDQAQISHVYPSAEAALSLAKIPVERNLSIFGIPPFEDAKKKIGTDAAILEGQRICQGRIEKIQRVDQDTRHLQVHGWAFDRKTHVIPKVLQITEPAGRIIGFALPGRIRPDVAATVDLAAFKSGFVGYFLVEGMGKIVTLNDPASGCSISAQLPK